MHNSKGLVSSLHCQLEKRKEALLFRQLQSPDSSFVDFWSNDYFALNRNPTLINLMKEEIISSSDLNIGATGSRLISGNYGYIEELEFFLESSMKAGSATFFPSSYLANLALLGGLASRHDTYIFDVSCHASLKEGMRLSMAKKSAFKHNNTDDLRHKLKLAQGNAYVVTESLFSMDGDFAPLMNICEICKEFGAVLIVDEAHAAGLFGSGGSGKVEELGLLSDDVIRIVGFGKAFGQTGGVVLGPKVLKDWISNFALPFIYSTGPSPIHVFLLLKSLEWLSPKLDEYQTLFQAKVAEFNQLLSNLIPTIARSPIQKILFPGISEVKEVCKQLLNKKIYTKAILPPTVPNGNQQIRLTWHLNNSEQELLILCEQLKSVGIGTNK